PPSHRQADMRKSGHLSFKWKLTLIIMGTCVLSLLAACAAFVWYDNYLFKQTMTSDLLSLAEDIRANSKIEIASGNQAAVNESLDRRLRNKDQIVAAAVWSRD